MTADAAAQPPKACADCRLRQLTCFLPTTPAELAFIQQCRESTPRNGSTTCWGPRTQSPLQPTASPKLTSQKSKHTTWQLDGRVVPPRLKA